MPPIVGSLLVAFLLSPFVAGARRTVSHHQLHTDQAGAHKTEDVTANTVIRLSDNFTGGKWHYDHLPNWREHLEAFWGDLMHTKNPHGIEPRCHPFIEGSGDRGVVLLMHGATACSNWWYLVKEPLIADGWMVIATTHIGHGRAPEIVHGANWRVTDFVDDLPTDGQVYIEYADELNKAMKKYRRDNPGKEMVIVAHSIGGTMSTNMVVEEPELWNKVLLMNPFFSPKFLPKHLGHTLTTAVARVMLPTVDYFSPGTHRWSEGCDAIRLAPNGGHGGMCQFSNYHLRAWLELGNIVQGKTEAFGSEHGVITGSPAARVWGSVRWAKTSIMGHQTVSPIQTQIMTTASDGAITNANVHFLSRAFAAWAKGGAGYCVVPKDFTHNWVCPVDFPWVDHWWLDKNRVQGGKTPIDHIASFVRDGTTVPTRGTVLHDHQDNEVLGDDLCDLHKAR